MTLARPPDVPKDLPDEDERSELYRQRLKLLNRWTTYKDRCAEERQQCQDYKKDLEQFTAQLRTARLKLKFTDPREWEVQERLRIKILVNEIHDEAFKRWLIDNVSFKRSSREDNPATARPGVLTVYDTFWGKCSRLAQCAEDDTARMDYLTFELGKVLWYRISPYPNVVPPGEKVETREGRLSLQDFLRQHDDMIAAMKFRRPDRLPLADWAEPQSRFAYVVRVAALDLEPPASAAEDFKEDWTKTRDELKTYMTTIISRDRRNPSITPEAVTPRP